MKPILRLIASLLTLGIALAGTTGIYAGDRPVRQPEPTPTIDRLAIPVLPEHPTQLEVGSSLYYYHCMPCHGDTGQGLTDEFRGIWVEDHQNCWGRGCHGGREKDEGFPFPKTIPAVNVTARSEQLFPEPENLYQYLSTTHPPQRPGTLQEDEYRALTVFLFSLAGRPLPAAHSGPEILALRLLAGLRLAVLVLGILLLAFAIVHWLRVRRILSSPSPGGG